MDGAETTHALRELLRDSIARERAQTCRDQDALLHLADGTVRAKLPLLLQQDGSQDGHWIPYTLFSRRQGGELGRAAAADLTALHRLAHPGDRSAVRVIGQASGSGKTKMAFDLALECEIPVVFIRLAIGNLQANDPAAWRRPLPWRHCIGILTKYCDVSRELAGKRDDADAVASRLRLAVAALDELRLVVAAHAHVVAQVIEGMSDEDRAYAALRALRNGHGERLVLARYQELRASLCGDEQRWGPVQRLLSVPDHARAEAALAEAVMGLGPRRVIAIDEVSVAMGAWRDLFLSRTAVDALRSGEGSPAAEAAGTDLFYGLCLVAEELAGPHDAPVVMFGSTLSIRRFDTRLGCSPLRGAPVVIDRLPLVGDGQGRISVLDFLTSHFDLPAGFRERAQPLVQALAGRPIWFFDHALPSLLDTLLSRRSGHAPLDSNKLEQAVLLALETGRRNGDGVAHQLAEAWFEDGRERAASVSPAALMRSLYAAALFGGGRLAVSEEQRRLLVDLGVLPVPASDDEVNLAHFPIIRDAILRVGSSRLRQNGPDLLLGPTSFAVLSNSAISVNGIKGALAEPLLALTLIYRSLTAVEGPRSLPELFRPFLDGSLHADPLDEWRAAPSVGMRAKAELPRTSFHFAVDDDGRPRADRLLFDFDNAAGADLAFWAWRERENGAREWKLVAVQVKCRESAQLRDMLRSVQPGKQYHQHRGKRAALLHLASDAPQLGRGWIRVVANANGYKKSVVSAVARRNRHADRRDSPIVLLRFRAEDGSSETERRLAAAAAGARTGRPTGRRWWTSLREESLR